MFNGIPPRAFNNHGESPPRDQQAPRHRRLNKSVNLFLSALSRRTHNLHYVAYHAGLVYDSADAMERSAHRKLLAKDGLHLSYAGCEGVCQNIIRAVASIRKLTPHTHPVTTTATTVATTGAASTTPASIWEEDVNMATSNTDVPTDETSASVTICNKRPTVRIRSNTAVRRAQPLPCTAVRTDSLPCVITSLDYSPCPTEREVAALTLSCDKEFPPLQSSRSPSQTQNTLCAAPSDSAICITSQKHAYFNLKNDTYFTSDQFLRLDRQPQDFQKHWLT